MMQRADSTRNIVIPLFGISVHPHACALSYGVRCIVLWFALSHKKYIGQQSASQYLGGTKFHLVEFLTNKQTIYLLDQCNSITVNTTDYILSLLDAASLMHHGTTFVFTDSARCQFVVACDGFPLATHTGLLAEASCSVLCL